MKGTPYFATLAEAFGYYTECALATKEGLEMRKRSGVYEKDRARSIAQGMVETCQRHSLKAPRGCPRLAKLLEPPPDA